MSEMIALNPEIERYVAQFEARRVAAEPEWLRTSRRAALEHFVAAGFPTTRDEEWKYTSVQSIVETGFQPARETAFSREELVSLPLIETVAARLVFINGRYAPEFSRIPTLPRGATLTNLASAASAGDQVVEKELGQYSRTDRNAFVALNTALWQDGGFLHLARGVILEEPVHFLFIGSGAGGPTESQVRNLVILEENSQATVQETYVGRNGEVYFTNAVTEVALGEGAIFDHDRVNLESDAAYHVATHQSHQSKASVLTSHSICFGGALTRNDLNAVLGGEGIESTLDGLYVPTGRQHVDNHTAIDHAMPNCNSFELYKGVLADRSTGVFNGKIFVRQDAQKTDSKQTNQNLLLSKEATIDTKPQLEIFADDVKCTHGATVGQLDEDALFYLRARGIGADDARNMLVYAFASAVLQRIHIDAVREELERLLYAKLAG
jgi:Fe-S cluster assembly protein SufD